MSAFYQISGSVLLQDVPEAKVLIDRLHDELPDGFELFDEPAEAGIRELTLSGGDFFAGGGALDLDDALRVLGRYAVVPAVFSYDYEGEQGIFGVGPDDAAVFAAESRHTLETEILPGLAYLTDEDCERLREQLACCLRLRAQLASDKKAEATP